MAAMACSSSCCRLHIFTVHLGLLEGRALSALVKTCSEVRLPALRLPALLATGAGWWRLWLAGASYDTLPGWWSGQLVLHWWCHWWITKFQMIKNNIFKISTFQITRPDFNFGVPKNNKVATKLISYERYGKTLFQKVASGYLLHFVLDGSSKNAL